MTFSPFVDSRCRDGKGETGARGASWSVQAAVSALDMVGGGAGRWRDGELAKLGNGEHCGSQMRKESECASKREERERVMKRESEVEWIRTTHTVSAGGT